MNKRPTSSNGKANENASEDRKTEINEAITAQLKTALKLLLATPTVVLERYTFPTEYTQGAINEKLNMVRFMIEDLTVNLNNYVND